MTAATSSPDQGPDAAGLRAARDAARTRLQAMLTICAAEAVVSTARLADLQAEIGAAQRGAAAARALLTAAYTDGHRAGVAAARQRAAGAEAKTGRVNAAALAEQHAIRAYRRAATAELLTQMERALEAEAALADFWRLRGLDRFSA